MLQVPVFNEKLFDPTTHHFNYNFKEMDDFILALDNYTDTHYVNLCRSIMRLLVATQTFLSAATLSPKFVKMREDNLSNTQFFENIFNEILQAINIAETERQQYQNDSMTYMFFSSAIDYCYKAILIRMIELKEANDALYTKFWHESALKKKLNSI